jgi:hypothetical protein
VLVVLDRLAVVVVQLQYLVLQQLVLLLVGLEELDSLELGPLVLQL